MISGEKWMLIWRSCASSSSVIWLLAQVGVEAGASIAVVRIIVLAVGKLRPPFADDVQHYQKLLARHARVELVEVREDEQVARRIPERAYVSVSFSRFLEDRRQSGRDLCFVVGGPYGLQIDADHKLSLGALTLPHQL